MLRHLACDYCGKGLDDTPEDNVWYGVTPYPGDPNHTGLCLACGGDPKARAIRKHHVTEYDDNDDDFEDDEDDRLIFADPGGRSALRAASEANPRNLPCPNCGSPDRLTPADVALGYQCDTCADSAEGYGP